MGVLESYTTSEEPEYDNVVNLIESGDAESHLAPDSIDWVEMADGFYTLHQHYEEISLEEGSRVFRELRENYRPSIRNAEEVLFRYAVEDKDLDSAIE